LASQLRLLNSQLKIANKAKEEFINTASHELRSPIQSIIGSVSLLLEKTNNIQQQQKLYEILYRNAKKLKILIQNLLDFPKIESRSLNLTKEKFYLNDFLLDIIKDYQYTYRLFHHYKFILKSLEGKDILIYADKSKISQVIYNLIDNSLKFIPEGQGLISVISEKKKIIGNDRFIEEIIIINVKDTGSGIDSEMMPKMFTKFSSKSEKGTGLGLYICKSIIEAHGGQIWANNNNDGKGATFSFSIPFANDSMVY
jgi:signal transduction histidine kinase